MALLSPASLKPAPGECLRFSRGGRTLELWAARPGMIRVRAWAGAEPRRASLVVPGPGPAAWREAGPGAGLEAGPLRVRQRPGGRGLRFEDAAGRALLEAGDFDLEAAPLPDGPSFRLRQDFRFATGEGLYGLGQFEDEGLDWQGRRVLLVQANRVIACPLLLSSRGYAILWDNASRSLFDARRSPARFESEAGEAVDYWVLAGGSMDGALAAYRRLTGQAPLLPRWAYGYWQSKERYRTQAELLETAAEFRRRGLPLDALVQDWQYWGENSNFSGMSWDRARYPDPAGMARALHRREVHLLASVWPAFGPDSAVYRELEARGLLLKPAHWCGGRVYDAFSPEARAIYWKHLKKGLLDKGVDAPWMDGTEPEFRCTDDRNATEAAIKAAGSNAQGAFARTLNAYSLLTTQGVYEGLRRDFPERRPLILTRSAFSGQQRHAAIAWSGDTFASWTTLRQQVAAGLSYSLAGLPYWTSDIGGFITEHRYPAGMEDPAYRELYVRWFQFGAFLPVFRAHGTNIPREPWRLGAEGSPERRALEEALRLRYRLLPYIYSTAAAVSFEGASFLRATAMEFPADARARGLATQYYFGPSLLVCPALGPGKPEKEEVGDYLGAEDLLGPDGSPGGLQLDFFAGQELARSAGGRRLDISNLGWAGCLPEGLDKQAYSARLSGRILAPRAGRYALRLASDGGVRLWLQGRKRVEAWDREAGGVFRAELDLKRGESAALRLEYRQPKPGQALLKLSWVKPGPPPPACRVYLPQGRRWYAFTDGSPVPSGERDLRPGLGDIPLFVSGGAILPLGPELQSTAGAGRGPLELRVYAGADGAFTLYEDEGEGPGWERGACARVPLAWSEASRSLSLGARQGSFPGLQARRDILVRLYEAGRSSERRLVYEGRPLELRWP